jgi:hypothetical protein
VLVNVSENNIISVEVAKVLWYKSAAGINTRTLYQAGITGGSTSQ